MIAGETAIRAAIENGVIEVTPNPTDDQYQPASLDVRLGEELYVPAADTYFPEDIHVINPDTRYLAHTMEIISLPTDVAAIVAGRSTIGRKGIIVHKTAGWIDPGFTGQITLELYNMGHETQRFSVGDRIAQLVFFEVDGGTAYNGQYQDQTGVEHAGSVE